MAKEKMIAELKKEFGNREGFSRKELLDFYCRFEPDLKRSTLRWRIFELRQLGVIGSNGRDWFSMNPKPAFIPVLGAFESRIFNIIERAIPGFSHCIWSTRILEELNAEK